MNFNDEFFNKVEKKTKVNKKTILDLAEKLNNGNMKNENTIREVIGTLSKITGKNISKEKEDRIIETILKDKVPKSIDKMGTFGLVKNVTLFISCQKFLTQTALFLNLFTQNMTFVTLFVISCQFCDTF